MTARQNDRQNKQAWQRLVEPLLYSKKCLIYRKQTKIAVTIVEQPEVEGNFFKANYTSINKILFKRLIQLIEQHREHWVNLIDYSRHIQSCGDIYQGVTNVSHCH